MAGGLVAFGGMADAAPRPTVDQVQARINQLTSQFDKVSEQLDQASQQLSAAQSKLSQVRLRFNHANAQFRAARANVAQTAAAAFEDTGATSVAGVQQMQRTEAGIAALKGQLAAHKNSLSKLIATQKAALASLTVPQQQQVQANSLGGNGSSAPQQYTGPTSTQAGKAVAFAYAQLGKPYQWGATGPGSYDCSGLVQAAWTAAGGADTAHHLRAVGRPAHIAKSALEPGDLVFMDGIGHVAMYVGNGDIIDAPRTGMNVQKVSLTGWYADTYGRRRPPVASRSARPG
jgi:peptidoglycan DL-endopeptidase CwlO